MPRVIGVDIPGNKPIWVALTYIYGVGRTVALRVLGQSGIKPSVRAKDLTEDELSRINAVIENNYVVEGRLRRQISQNIQRLREISSYRGLRHRRGLPLRGQRTRTNARTRKGKKKTVAVKKSVKEMH